MRDRPKFSAESTVAYVSGISRFRAETPGRDDDNRERNADEERQTFIAAAMTGYRIQPFTRAPISPQFEAVLCLPIPFQAES